MHGYIPGASCRTNMNTTELIRHIRLGRLRRYARRAYFAYRLRTAHERVLPDILILGAQRAGTTSLHKYLIQHPKIYSNELAETEVHFFDAKHVPGAELASREAWYRAHFPRRRELEAQSRVLDSTPNYLFDPLAPQRIRDMLPQAKLIVLLRDPIQRAISHYFKSRRKDNEPLEMLEAFQQEEARFERAMAQEAPPPDFVFGHTYKSRGRYAEQLERYAELFPQENMLILVSEEFFSSPQSTLRRVFEFIGVDAGFSVPDLRPANVGSSRHPVPAEARDYLEGYFEPYNRVLFDLLGRELQW
jgi:hypothetical protein